MKGEERAANNGRRRGISSISAVAARHKIWQRARHRGVMAARNIIRRRIAHARLALARASRWRAALQLAYLPRHRAGGGMANSGAQRMLASSRTRRWRHQRWRAMR